MDLANVDTPEDPQIPQKQSASNNMASSTTLDYESYVSTKNGSKDKKKKLRSSLPCRFCKVNLPKLSDHLAEVCLRLASKQEIEIGRAHV